MAKGGKELNVISEATEASEDRGPLVQDKELSEARDMVKEATNNTPASADEVLAFLEADDLAEDTTEEVYLDNRVIVARDIRPMIAAWHEYKGAMAQVKTSYKLWKVESELGGASGSNGEDPRKENLIQSASRIKTSIDFIEGEVKEAFPKLQGVAFLTRSELVVLPTWMHTLLNLQIEATPQEKLVAQEELQKSLESKTNQE